MKTKLLALLVLFGWMKNSRAQDTLSLTLSDALSAVVKNNRQMALATLDKEAAAARYHQANAVFLPQVNLSYTALATDNPLNAFGFKLQQQSVSPEDFNPQLLNNPSVSRNYFAKAELT